MEQVAAPTLRKRDPWLDNAKGLLMILVVTGHLLAPITNYSRMAKWLYYLINSFHMPMFLMISGFLSRRRILQKDNVGIINKLVTPYLLAQILLYVLACFIPGGVYEIGADYDRMSFLKPIYALWYIFAMILYNLVCVQWQPQKRPVLSLAVVMAMSLGIGCFRMIDFMYLSKIIGFFPYFMMGFLAGGKVVERIRKPSARTIAAGAVILAGWGVFIYFGCIRYHWIVNSKVFLMTHRYTNMEAGDQIWYGLFARLAMLTLTPVIATAMLAVMPRVRTVLTHLGERSVYIYVLHCLFIIAYRCGGWGSYITTPARKIGLIAAAVGISFLLASKPVQWAFHRILEPKADIRNLFRQDCSGK